MKKIVTAIASLAAFCAAQGEPATYAIDPLHTFVTYEALHLGTSTSRGRFGKSTGSIQFDRAGKTGKVDISVDIVSLSTGVPSLDKHLQAADFFNVETFPNARFVGDKFSFDGDKLVGIGGDLTLLGKTLPVTLRATQFNCYAHPFYKREACGGDFETTIERSRWGMGGLTNIASDKIRLLIQVESLKQ
jgi:polyisoprenoid-binding protein YceI